MDGANTFKLQNRGLNSVHYGGRCGDLLQAPNEGDPKSALTSRRWIQPALGDRNIATLDSEQGMVRTLT